MYERFVTKEAFTAVGIKWTGTFSAAFEGVIRKEINAFRERMNEIEHVVNPETLLGITTKFTEDGFTYYICLEVSNAEAVPEGMSAITVPAKLYAVCSHEKGQSVDATYDNIATWYQSQGYEKDDTGYGMEKYRSTYDPLAEETEFWVYEPVRKKT
ncbi:Predicted transcriptional regulator YdeE, contains AraC-type DNA-binding domain [Evansella caseinilytica]|uniref:Predicted transcriptional regulator YdeE, contains AraC-type DNA-binding domain n=1 Tax=Evansella caseinilytica TaxID=1503961 RepID=A0A1H3GN00_9BACI|nr:effector binding domain-containing protein [Evansella caseinilytica]SDY03884.1 Predicted transcriptional regulator YdeE, contains AraC-type DNA-binding domain [Evansella caseinilytica]